MKKKEKKETSFFLALACHWFNWLASGGDGCMQSVNTKSKSPNPIQPSNAFAFFRLFLRSRREQINFLLVKLFLTPRARN
uniref:Putative secreted protein n=1 Tax=Ixodes ricinus TaxID=34613 RepID=A0A6B0TXV4_IXORI